jgi:hypothetical protein
MGNALILLLAISVYLELYRTGGAGDGLTGSPTVPTV